MARAILVMGLSGTGKSTSWRNVPSEQAMVITPNNKQLPFPGSKEKYKKVDMKTGKGNVIVTKLLEELPSWLDWVNTANHIKYLLIDDWTHFFNARIMSKSFVAQNSGNAAFAKWNVFGSDVYDSILGKLDHMREDLTIIVMHHTALNDAGKYTFKSSGKLLENVIDPMSYFTYVLHTRIFKSDTVEERYKFQTNGDDVYEAKTPMGCFNELYIPNDVYAVMQRINEYETTGQ